MSCDSTPVPETKPRSSGRISVTGTPEGFLTPEVAQPEIRPVAAARAMKVRDFMMYNPILVLTNQPSVYSARRNIAGNSLGERTGLSNAKDKGIASPLSKQLNTRP
jgi:hypothetical protein